MSKKCALPKKMCTENNSSQCLTMYSFAKVLFLLVWLNSFMITNSQNVWKIANISENAWKAIGNIPIKRNNGLTIQNTRPMINRDSKEEENRLFTESFPGISLNTKYIGTYVDVSFDVINYTKVPEYKMYWSVISREWITIDKRACWIIEVEYMDDMQRLKNEKKWVIRPPYPYNEYDGNEESYGNCKNNRTVRVCFVPNVLEIYLDDINLSHIENVKSLKSIKIRISPEVHLKISNVSCKSMTKYGQASPYLTKANEYLNHNNPSLAASEMTIAIDKGLKCYETYLLRGIAYYMQGFYKSAIEDFTSAISHSSTNKEKAYFYRGMSKLAIDDDYGVIDLKSGGQEGLVFLRENNLMDYTPGQKKSKVAKTPKRNSPSHTKKPILKK